MKLLGSTLSPYALRVLIAARAKGIDLPIVEPAGGSRSAEFLALSPIGKVPVLVDGAVVLPESSVILAYLEDRFPTPSLLPGDATQRANARLLVSLIDGYGAPSFGPFFADDKAAIKVALEKIDTSLGYVDHFRRDGAFASGDAFSIADCALIPFFIAFEMLPPQFGTFEFVKKRPKLAAWWQRARASDHGGYAMKAMMEAAQKFMAQQQR